MNPKKITAIGITALFLALVVLPVQGSIIKKDDTRIPIELSMVQADGSVGSTILSLTREQIQELSELITRYSHTYNRGGLLDALKDFFKRIGGKTYVDMFDQNLINVLPGSPIFSIGEGREYLSRYHGRVQFKKVFSFWSYPDNGFTMIIGNNFSPKQILFQRQMGFMVGFVGVYIYIPEFLESQDSGITCFAGSALFAWGTSF